jgi:hypothetical protein
MKGVLLRFGKNLMPSNVTKVLPLLATIGWVAVFTLKAFGHDSGALEEFLKSMGVQPGVSPTEIALTVGSVQGLAVYFAKAWKDAVAAQAAPGK